MLRSAQNKRPLATLRRTGGSRRPLNVAVDSGRGPTVVLVHGIASSYTTFENLLALFGERHRVIAVDLLGFGGSAAPDGATFTLEEHVEYLRRTIASLHIRGPFVLVGHSMGALISARFAARMPRLVRGLVLVSPPVYLPAASVGHPGDRAAMGLYSSAYSFARGNKDLVLRAAARLGPHWPVKGTFDISETTWNAFSLSLERSIESQTAIADVARVDAPIRLVYGTRDPLLARGTLRIVERMRHVTTHRVRGGDHLIRPATARVIAAAVDALLRTGRPGPP
jgi:cis-3-alkyl-4-acyloxetan-2-one decarboxylase